MITLVSASCNSKSASWIRIDNFECTNPLVNWTNADTRNDTDPYIENPQITKIKTEESKNHYLIKKPAAEGIVGNRKALSYIQLPTVVKVGDIYTFYTRINVEYFPNNHVFGLSNLEPAGINEHDYDAFEPTLRVTDKYESDGYKNDGTLMVRKGNRYDKIRNDPEGEVAKPLKPNTWYEVWYVVNNKLISEGGQTYDVYLKGGYEFPSPEKVYEGADFRMKRELPLIYFLANCNTGPLENPYGNGGLSYDDIYMSEGVTLTAPK